MGKVSQLPIMLVLYSGRSKEARHPKRRTQRATGQHHTPQHASAMVQCCQYDPESATVTRDPACITVAWLAVPAHPATQCWWAGRHKVDACGL